MKWGKNESSSSLINHVFPVSWLSKFKHGNSQESAKMKQNLPSFRSCPTTNVSLKQGRFYTDEYCDQVSTWNSKKNDEFNRMVSRKIREKPRKSRIPQKEEAEFSSRKRNSIKDDKLRKLSRKALEERIAENAREPDQEEEGREADEVIEKDIFEIEPENYKILQRGMEKTTTYNSRKQKSTVSCTDSSLEEGCVLRSLNLDEESDAFSEEEYKDTKIREISGRRDCEHRKSVYLNQKRRRKHGIKVKANSPRIECKIKALEDMKKTKAKTRQKKTEEISGGDRTGFDSYVVVMSSFDPSGDFRDSMVEMIVQRGIMNSEELEELLACYLTLNCDEYHDLIIKVFRQVWFELIARPMGSG